MESTQALFAIVGMLVAFGLPLLLVVVILFFRHRKLRMTHETIARLADKGLPVPPELLEPRRRGNSGLRGGLVLVALGFATGIFFAQTGVPWSIGLIPGLMGVALLISWGIERRQD